MPFRCEGLCDGYYSDEEPLVLPTGERVCRQCEKRPLPAVVTLSWDSMPSSLLLFKAGDNYEAYDEDAEVLAKILKTNYRIHGSVFITGFHHTFLDAYVRKIVAAGRRVAVCERVADPEKEKYTLKNAQTIRRLSQSTPLPKVKQLPLLRGLDDCPGQQDLFDDMTAS